MIANRIRRLAATIAASVAAIIVVSTLARSAERGHQALRIYDAVIRTDLNPHEEMRGTTVPQRITVEAWVQWRNAWRNSRNHDAVWAFVKVIGSDANGERVARHARILAGSVATVDEGVGNAALAVRVPVDATGFFVIPANRYRGDVRAKVRVSVNADILAGLATESVRAYVFGIEMVYVPEGAFFAGAASDGELSYGALYRSGDSGVFNGPYAVEAEGAIEIGAKPGALNYRTLKSKSYLGDGKGPVPAAFPKGYHAFYIMKRELTQGLYAAFLDTLAGYGADMRANFAGPTYYSDRGTIRLEQGRYVATSPDRPANFVGWEDAIAVLDWAALRPMTELEFEKAARGPRQPKPSDYVWGTTSTDKVERTVLDNGDVGMASGASEAMLTDATVEWFGASHYWVMDLSGSLWERVVSIGDAAGRAFTGTHGDGSVNAYGDADVVGWPRELGSPRREKGFGYRGGGFYLRDQLYDAYRPHSPVSHRPYGSWSGGPRHRAYGIRGVRTAEW